eukprot:1160961-Pelagomonas_calceolata.AAC.6
MASDTGEAALGGTVGRLKPWMRGTIQTRPAIKLLRSRQRGGSEVALVGGIDATMIRYYGEAA